MFNIEKILHGNKWQLWSQLYSGIDLHLPIYCLATLYFGSLFSSRDEVHSIQLHLISLWFFTGTLVSTINRTGHWYNWKILLKVMLKHPINHLHISDSILKLAVFLLHPIKWYLFQVIATESTKNLSSICCCWYLDLDLLCLMPHSAIFQLYRGDQF